MSIRTMNIWQHWFSRFIIDFISWSEFIPHFSLRFSLEVLWLIRNSISLFGFPNVYFAYDLTVDKWTASRQDTSTRNTQRGNRKQQIDKIYIVRKIHRFYMETLNQGKNMGEQIFTIIVGVQEKENRLQPLHNRVFPLGLKH